MRTLPTHNKTLQKLDYPNADNSFRFITNQEVASTDNINERELRAFVIIRKTSNRSGSPRVANATAILLSIVQTLRFNKKNILHGLQEIVESPPGC